MSTSKNVLKEFFPDLKYYKDNGNFFIQNATEEELRKRLSHYKVNGVPDCLAISRYKIKKYKELDIYDIGSRYFLLKTGTKGCYFFEL